MSKNLFTGIVLVIAIGALFILFTWQLNVPAKFDEPSSATQSTSHTFDLLVRDRKLVAGSSTLSVKQGDDVTINITVDEDEELHLHGYDVHIDLQKDVQGSLSLHASSSGRFPFELEHSSTELGALEVQP